MGHQILLLVTAVITLLDTVPGVLSVRCYQCYINAPPDPYNNITKRPCTTFDASDTYVVDCPYSTMCVKQEFYLDIQNGVRIKGVQRDCAQQKFVYKRFEASTWSPHLEVQVQEPYQEGCHTSDDKGEKATAARYCYCRKDLCNSAPSTSHEGYTDIMGVIVVFNLMKYINSIR